jgi:hypothetical protein
MANISPQREALAGLLIGSEADRDQRFDPHALDLRLDDYLTCTKDRPLVLRQTVTFGNLGHTAAVYGLEGPALPKPDETEDVVHHNCNAAVLHFQPDPEKNPHVWAFRLLVTPSEDRRAIPFENFAPVEYSQVLL